MSLNPRLRDGTNATIKANNPQHAQQVEVEVEVEVEADAEADAEAEVEAASSSSSSWRRHSQSNSFPHSLLKDNKSRLEESDEDLFTVPDVEASRPPIDSTISPTSNVGNNNNPDVLQDQTAFTGKRRRGRNPVDKEYRRLKRLLRNRVSAQQARERKKVYVNDLESRAKVLQDRNSKLEEKISTLINENSMLRKVLMNTRPKVDESIEPKHDLWEKS